jgi:hypothetical protein
MIDDAAIRAVVSRLARQHPSGGRVVERAAVMAEGTASTAILTWIADHDGQPETVAPAKSAGGLHHGRLSGVTAAGTQAPRRYVLPPGVLN